MRLRTVRSNDRYTTRVRIGAYLSIGPVVGTRPTIYRTGSDRLRKADTGLSFRTFPRYIPHTSISVYKFLTVQNALTETVQGLDRQVTGDF